MTANPRERLLDLLSAEATQGLSEDEVRELRGLLLIVPDEDPDSLAYAAAAADLAMTDRISSLPAGLARQIERQGAAFFANTPEPVLPSRPARTPRSAYIAWALVAGLAAILVWTLRPKPNVLPGPTPTIEEQFTRLQDDPSSRSFAGEKASVSGQIVWNLDKQQGYLKLTGLAGLDPTKEQYQLWIVDPSQSHPIDGGMFDAGPEGTAIVLIQAKLKVKGVQAFTVTREPSGGVVVSKSPHLVVLAPRPG